jgi:hypothetical protein
VTGKEQPPLQDIVAHAVKTGKPNIFEVDHGGDTCIIITGCDTFEEARKVWNENVAE